MSIDSVNVYAIGDNVYGIVLEAKDSGQGYVNTSTSIYVRLGHPCCGFLH